MIEVANLNFDYPERPLLRDVNLSVHPGQLLHLRGANGAGKTTLLKLIAGLLQPTSGKICFQGVSIANDRTVFQRSLCYIGHKSGISQLLTVKENCELSLGTDPTFDLAAVLDKFSLLDDADRLCSSLSAGQRRRVGLMRLLLTDATLWLLDEPLNALDQEGISALMCCLQNHLAQNGCVILTSHQALPLQIERYLEYLL